MTAQRNGWFHKATALLPLALLSTAVTASLVGAGPTATTAVAGEDRPATLPDGTTVPEAAIEAPASVSVPGSPTRDVRPGLAGAARTASTSGIPAAALSAYQRSETVINSADRSCSLPWQLVAAIGRVESDHGRANGNTLGDDGVASPGIFGIALNGSNNTQAIRDTDAGQYDSDAKWDRAVGPMQFIPSTWSVVGVDGDNDGERNPQDIDDAALASAVYLCSGRDDLATETGLRSAIFRYNHSDSYVDLVLSFMEAYMSGDFTSVPNGIASAGYFAPAPEPKEPKPEQPQDNGGGQVEQPDQDLQEEPTTPPAEEPAEEPDVEDLPTPSLPPVEDTLTEAEALAECVADGVIDNPLTSVNELTQCVTKLLG
jgi:hypothetical protein